MIREPETSTSPEITALALLLIVALTSVDPSGQALARFHTDIDRAMTMTRAAGTLSETARVVEEILNEISIWRVEALAIAATGQKQEILN